MLGFAPISIEDLANRITREIPNIAETPRGERTKRILAALHKIAEEVGVRAQATGLKNADENGRALSHEFLLDMVWWEGDSRLVLAVESELSSDPGEREKDFRKLLAIKSPLKVMIVVAHKDQAEIDGFIGGLDTVVKEWGQHLHGEQYLAYVFADGANQAYCARIDEKKRPTRFKPIARKAAA